MNQKIFVNQLHKFNPTPKISLLIDTNPTWPTKIFVNQLYEFKLPESLVQGGGVSQPPPPCKLIPGTSRCENENYYLNHLSARVSESRWEMSVSCSPVCDVFTDVDEIWSVLAGHAEAEIPPEAGVLLNHLQGDKWRDAWLISRHFYRISWFTFLDKHFPNSLYLKQDVFVTVPLQWFYVNELCSGWRIVPYSKSSPGCNIPYNTSVSGWG